MVAELLRTAGQNLRRIAFLPLLFLMMTGSPTGVQGGDFGAPSNLAGIWKMEILPGTHLISFPLLPENASVTSLLADHFPSGDTYEEATRIATIGEEGYQSSWYNSTGSYWAGTLHQLDPEKAYWLVIPEGSDPVALTLVGQSLGGDTVSVGTISEGMNLVAAPVPYAVTLAASGLIESGFKHSPMVMNADRVSSADPAGFLTAWATDGSNWNGDHFLLEPEKGYVLWRAPGEGGFDWDLVQSLLGNLPDLEQQSPEEGAQLEQLRFAVPTLTTPTGQEAETIELERVKRDRGGR